MFKALTDWVMNMINEEVDFYSLITRAIIANEYEASSSQIHSYVRDITGRNNDSFQEGIKYARLIGRYIDIMESDGIIECSRILEPKGLQPKKWFYRLKHNRPKHNTVPAGNLETT